MKNFQVTSCLCVTKRLQVRALESATDKVRIGYPQYIPWGGAFPHTLREYGMLVHQAAPFKLDYRELNGKFSFVEKSLI